MDFSLVDIVRNKSPKESGASMKETYGLNRPVAQNCSFEESLTQVQHFT